MAKHHDIIIVGAGAVGLAAGIGFAQAGCNVAVIGTDTLRRDGRTVALMETSLKILDRLGLRHLIETHGTPLVNLSIVDDTRRLFRAPPVTFHAHEIGLDAFGTNIEATPLVELIAGIADETPRLTRYRQSAQAISRGAVTLDDGTSLFCELLVGADGRHSTVRKAAGITTREWRYDQTAITAIFAHDKPHGETSTEFHTSEGPFTLVPMQGQRSSLVWLCKPERAANLMALDDNAFARAVETQAHSMLGGMRLDGPRGSVPMGGVSVDDVAADGIALAGEAAHVFPPIGAQGLNLGLRDVSDLISAFTHYRSESAAARYRKARLTDITVRTQAVDALNRSLLADFLPADAARVFGLSLLGAIGPLRRFVMRQGLGG